MDERLGKPRLALDEAAAFLGLPEAAVEALVDGGYLDSVGTDEGRAFALGDLKAFHARNRESTGDLHPDDVGAVDPQALLDALDGRADEMARRAFEIFTTVFPEAAAWSEVEQTRFVDQARKRFEAILAVTGQGEEVDRALVDDLQDVGAAAAWSGSPLPQLLVVLRISRDLVVQTAIEVAEGRGRRWGLALSLLLTRVLPAMDRLTDAIAQGYWAAVVGREEESRSRYENVVERSSDGIYEVDLDGFITYANTSLAVMLGRSLDEIVDNRVNDVFVSVDDTDVTARLAYDVDDDRTHVELAVRRADGVHRTLDIGIVARREEGAVVGYAGVVRDVTAAYELDHAKNQFLALITHDVRNPLTTILGLGVTLSAYADELSPERIQRMGGSIRRQAERIARLADDLYDVSQLESRSLVLTPRPVDVAAAVEAALASVPDTDDVDVDVPRELRVLADGRRLEQVVANLVENALVHGAAPVCVEARERPGARGATGTVEVAVLDGGRGVPDALRPTLFSRLRTFGRPDRDRSRGTGLGLSLVRGLVEAMGGRVWYDPRKEGGSAFRFTLPTANG